MKKITVILTIILVSYYLGYSQKYYFELSSNYNIPVTNQIMPQYFDISSNTYFFGDIPAIYTDSVFSIAEGVNVNGSIGYNLNKYFSVELNFGYYFNTRKEFEGTEFTGNYLNGNSHWSFSNYSIGPNVLVGKSTGKSTFNILLSGGIGISSLTVKVSEEQDELYWKYKFNNTISYYYGYGVEYWYSISPAIQLGLNLGINNLYFTPKHSELVSNSYNTAQYFDVRDKEIDYVKEIKDSNPKRYEPDVRLEETLRVNSAYFGVGIKYTISNHEEK